MSVDMKPTQPRYWLITSPRTASNMLVKILNLDEQGVRPTYQGGYFFLHSAVRRVSKFHEPLDTWTEGERAEMYESEQQSLNTLQDYITKAEEEGQLIYVKEHALMLNDFVKEHEFQYGRRMGESQPLKVQGLNDHSRSKLNITALPDAFLKTWNPTFLIRHPAIMFPSYVRAMRKGVAVDGFKRAKDEPEDIEMSLRWNRALYDFYAAHFTQDSPWPLVLDADDIMQSQEFVKRYATMAGLDPEKLRFTWDQTPGEQIEKLDPAKQVMLSSILASNKVDTSKLAGNIDIAKEAIKWRSEFGEEGGAQVERWVRNAMPDYEYLHFQRLRLE